jgi:glycosyltransferase involved in cell wall biosynthesis
LEREIERWSEWIPAAEARRDWNAMSVREEEEWRLADLLIVPSEFVYQSLLELGVPAAKMRMVAYGRESEQRPATARERRGGPLRLLFVGNLGIQKGVGYLAEAVRIARDCGAELELACLGGCHLSAHGRAAMEAAGVLHGVCSPAEVAAEMDRADCLVFPTLCDGFGWVQVEAAMRELPIIATKRCGEVVRDEVDGLIVEPANAEALASAIVRLAKERDLLATMSRNLARRAEYFSLQAYEERLAVALQQWFR